MGGDELMADSSDWINEQMNDAFGQVMALVQKQGSLLAASPPTAAKLLGILRKPDYDNAEIVQLASYDHLLTARLLRVANSARFGGNNTIRTLDEAVLRMGARELVSIVLSLDFKKVFTSGPKWVDTWPSAQSLWSHAILTALASSYLARKCSQKEMDPSVCFTAGLLHDFGKTALVHSEHPSLGKVPEAVAGGIPWIEAERLMLGTDHAELGGAILHLWGLPGGVIRGVQEHHNPKEDSSGLAAVIELADYAAHYSADDGLIPVESPWDTPLQDDLNLGLPDTAFEDVLTHLEREEKFVQSLSNA